MSSVCLNQSPPYFLKQGLLPNVMLAYSARQTGTCLSRATPVLGSQFPVAAPGFYMGIWDPNLAPRVYKAITLPTEPYSQSNLSVSFKIENHKVISVLM